MLKMTSDINKIISEIKKTSKQVDKAVAEGVNKVGFDVRQKLTDDMDKYIDGPTPFTKKGWLLKKANSSNKKATVLLMDAQAKYLQWVIFGGTQKSLNKMLTTPTKKARLNKYGNVPGKRYKGLVRGKKQFVATISGVLGVWQEVGTKRDPRVMLLHVFGSKKQYKEQYPVFKIANKEAEKMYQVKLNRAFEKAFR